MSNYADEYLVREILRSAEERDRQLERRGWFRAMRGASSRRLLRVRVGARLVRLGLWIQGTARPADSATKVIAADGPCP
ncbi:MAG: hypothetical protein NTW68_04275 [candidate division NC10 bacterium]|nr:hypothetical protein [candidate division NC10 bacterium]